MAKVKVEQGWLLGEHLDTITGDGKYYSFKGIPYAAPPVGDLRFKAPQPPLAWDGLRNATEHGPVCPQFNIITQQIQNGNEDCLYLNVYTPALKPFKPLPIMVFIHGGGYKSGSGNSDNYGPDILVSHDVILVTLNYRLEVLGFLCLDTEEVPGNAGMKDQVAALKWVNKNIGYFGGDPNNVTVFGESAGGAAALYHVLSPMSKGLLKRAISMSGVPVCDWSIAFEPVKRAFTLSKQLGLETDDPKELLDFLQEVPVEQLLDTNPSVLSFEERNQNVLKMYHFTPVIEKKIGKDNFLTEDPLEILRSGKINDMDILFGYTDEEALFGIEIFEQSLLKDYNRYPEMFVPRKIQLKCTPDQMLEISSRIKEYYFKGKPVSVETMKEFVKYTSDASFVYDINRYVSRLAETGQGRRYMYKFSCVSDRNVYGRNGVRYGIRAAAHVDDCLYLFDAKRFNMKLEKNTTEYNLVQLVCTIFTNFAKYGNPTPDSSLGLTWPQYNAHTRPYVNITDKLTTEADPDADSYKFWQSIYEYAKIEY